MTGRPPRIRKISSKIAIRSASYWTHVSGPHEVFDPQAGFGPTYSGQW
jgi:hypothetical protein